MKNNLVRLILLTALSAALLHAADDPRGAAVLKADDERTAAYTAADKEKLGAILSDDLRYAHSNGGVDTKASMIEALTSGKTKYKSFDYDERNVSFAAPNIALMTGRVKVKVSGAAGDLDLVLGFLAVYREENGKWRFLAWQSCKIPPPEKK